MQQIYNRPIKQFNINNLFIRGRRRHLFMFLSGFFSFCFFLSVSFFPFMSFFHSPPPWNPMLQIYKLPLMSRPSEVSFFHAMTRKKMCEGNKSRSQRGGGHETLWLKPGQGGSRFTSHVLTVTSYQSTFNSQQSTVRTVQVSFILRPFTHRRSIGRMIVGACLFGRTYGWRPKSIMNQTKHQSKRNQVFK